MAEGGNMNFPYESIKIKKQSLFARLKSAVIYAVLAEVPPCGGERDGWSGEFDCPYESGIDCDTCVCLYYEHGYRKGLDPRTGKKFKKIRRRALVKNPIDSKGNRNKKVLYCYNCGTNVKDQKYCHGCGYKLVWNKYKS